MYQAPVKEIAFTLKHVAGLKSALDSGVFTNLDEGLVDAILEEAASPPRKSRRFTRSATKPAPCWRMPL